MNIERIRWLVGELQRELDSVTEGDGDRLDQFIATCHKVADREIPFSEFYSAFKKWLPRHEHGDWPKLAVAQRLKIVNRGRRDQPKKMVVGLSWTPVVEWTPEPANPAYDAKAVFWTIHRLADEKLSFHEIAMRLNAEGSLDQRGELWSEGEVKQVWSD